MRLVHRRVIMQHPALTAKCIYLRDRRAKHPVKTETPSLPSPAGGSGAWRMRAVEQHTNIPPPHQQVGTLCERTFKQLEMKQVAATK